MTIWIGQENGRWAFTGAKPQTYDSSTGSTRGFCATCGTPIFYRSDRHPAETHFYAALLTDPTTVAPTTHYHSTERLP